MAYLASFAWGLVFALVPLGLRAAWKPVRALVPRRGPVAAVAFIACFVGLLGFPRAVGLIDEAGWLGVALFAAGLLCVELPAYRRMHAREATTRRVKFESGYEDSDFSDSAEAAALAGWPRIAEARALRTRYLSDLEAEVLVDTVPSHPVAVRCEKFDRGWIWTSDVNA